MRALRCRSGRISGAWYRGVLVRLVSYPSTFSVPHRMRRSLDTATQVDWRNCVPYVPLSDERGRALAAYGAGTLGADGEGRTVLQPVSQRRAHPVSRDREPDTASIRYRAHAALRSRSAVLASVPFRRPVPKGYGSPYVWAASIGADAQEKRLRAG